MPDDFYDEGVYDIESAHNNARAGKNQTIQGNICLKDLEKDYALFSHGLYFTRGNMLVEPLHDFKEIEKDAIIRVDLPVSIFDGMGGGYDNILFGCVHDKWVKLSLFLHTISGANQLASRYWTGLTQEIPLLDIFNFTNPSSVTVTLFGVSGTDALYAGLPPEVPTFNNYRIKIVKYPPEAQTLNLFNGLLKKDVL